MTNHKEKLSQILSRFLPAAALERCVDFIIFYNIHLHIEGERKSKYGDYMPHEGKSSRISVNGNLSRFEFLITFIHEASHHTAYLKYKNTIESHGKEWKNEFKQNFLPFFQIENLFPYDLKSALQKHMQNPLYSQSADINLMKLLKKYDSRIQNHLTLSQVPDGTIFRLHDDPTWMRRIKKLRTYVLCENIKSQAKYKVHAMAEIVLAD